MFTQISQNYPGVLIFNAIPPNNADFILDEHPYIAGFNAVINNGGLFIYYREIKTTMDPLNVGADILDHISGSGVFDCCAADFGEDILIVTWKNGTYNSEVRVQAHVRSV